MWILALVAVLLFPIPAKAVTVTLEWNGNTESDLAGYEVWRNLKACSTPEALSLFTKIDKALTTWQDASVPDDTEAICYGLKAFDTSKNVSPMSNLAGKQLIRPEAQLLGHWLEKTDIAHEPSQNLKRYTIHALVKPKAPLVGFNPIFVKNYTYFLYASVKGYCGDGGILVGNDSTHRLCTPEPLEPNRWTAVTATYDGAQLKLYRDGVFVTSGQAPAPLDSTESMQIAGSKFNETCNCDLEVWLYDQALTSDEVAALPLTKDSIAPKEPTDLKLLVQ